MRELRLETMPKIMQGLNQDSEEKYTFESTFPVTLEKLDVAINK